MNIDKLIINKPLILAPMAGITDQPFRQICKSMGAGLVYTEFVSSNGIIRENMKTLDMMNFSENERPIGIQLFGEDPEIVAKSAKIVFDRFKPDIIDINYGCPVPKVTKKGAGSAALKDLCLMEEMTQAVIEAVPIPVTVKMRAGWDNNNIVSTEAGIKLEKIGVSAITLHPRTTKQLFSGKSNWSLIKDLKSAVNIPIIGNGDILNIHDYNNMLIDTGCDAVMIGRGALGNPWIFKSILKNNIEYSKDNIKIIDIVKTAKNHFNLLKHYYNENICINHSKKHFSWYFKGFDGASKIRKLFMRTESIIDFENILSDLETNST